jgi:hypothetical protein
VMMVEMVYSEKLRERGSPSARPMEDSAFWSCSGAAGGATTLGLAAAGGLTRSQAHACMPAPHFVNSRYKNGNGNAHARVPSSDAGRAGCFNLSGGRQQPNTALSALPPPLPKCRCLCASSQKDRVPWASVFEVAARSDDRT